VFDVHHKPRGLTSLPSCDLSQVHKVQHKPTKKLSWELYKSLEQRQVEVLPVAHRTLSGAQAEHPHELTALGFFQSSSAIIHWTVRCAPYMSGEPKEQRSNAPNSRQRCTVKSEQCASQKSELRSQNTQDCPVCTGLSDAARGQMTSMVNRSKPK
jgi:hypothetical protein